MKIRNLWIVVGFLATSAGLIGQQAETFYASSDDAVLKSLPRLVLPADYATRPLPSKKDNTRVIHFPGIYSQDVWNCNQASSIWTMFTYEINYLRNLNSSLPENQYSPMAIYNLLNYGSGSNGVSYFDSWNVIKSNGIPGNQDFNAYNQNSTTWMTGYDKYYRGMKNRVNEVFAIDVGSPEGLLTLKHWINDHLNGSQIGGLANFQIGSGDMVIPQIPLDQDLEEEGQYIVTKYGPYVGHAMTFAGWNDSVRFDVNGDGRYTNNIDIDGDGEVTMKDWEIGAMLVVNSWGVGWGNAGKVWVMYRLLAEPVTNGGIWNNAAMVVKPKRAYEPLLTVRTKIRYNQRNRLKIQVGISSDMYATLPEKTMDFSCFNFQGDALPMQGIADVNSDLIEIGLDITPLLNYLTIDGKGRVFLEIVQKTPTNEGSGDVESFSVIDYSKLDHVFQSTEVPVTIQRNSITRLSVPVDIQVAKPQIITESLDDAAVGVEYRYQIEADGTTGPYQYDDPARLYVETPEASAISMTGGNPIFADPGAVSQVVDLPFGFTFYGTTYDQIVILRDGGVVMGSTVVNYPYVIDQRMRFYQNAGVFPFLANLHYLHAENTVTYERSSEAAVIRWNATADAGGQQPVEFAVKLFPDGKMQLFYGNMEHAAEISWISGVSAGNNLDYHLMDQNASGIQINTAFSLNLMAWPAWLSLGSNGDLHGTPDKSGFYTLPFTVTDWFGIKNTKELTLKVTGGSGIPSTEQIAGVKTWPNPVDGEMWFEGNSTQSGTITLSVYDLAGHLLFTRDYAGHAGLNTIRCTDVNDLKSGVYLYQMSGIMQSQGKLVKKD